MQIESLHNYLNTQPTFASAGLIQLRLNDRVAGYLEPAIEALLGEFAAHWRSQNGVIHLGGALLAAQFLAAAEYLREQRSILHWRNEDYGVCTADELGFIDFNQPLFTLERAAFRRFGLVSRAVHINGYCQNGDIWLAKRAESKGIDPGKLDNMAAGGIPHGEAILDCAIRELAEEAGVPASLAKQLQYIGEQRVQRNESDGTHDEVLYCFDLCLPDDFTPYNTDGEVAAFYRISPDAAAAQLATMTWDAGRVMADFLLRHHT